MQPPACLERPGSPTGPFIFSDRNELQMTETAISGPPTSYAGSAQVPPLGVQGPLPPRVRVKVSDPTRAIELRDYFRRLGLCALAADCGTVEAEGAPGSDLRSTREEIGAYIDSWVKTNRVPVQLG
jgi:hypothetical protein